MRKLLVASLLALLPSAALAVDTVSTLTGGFSASGGVVTDAQGNIYVGDFGPFNGTGHQIYKITPTGTVSVFATGVSSGPTGGRFDAAGDLFWSAYSTGRIYRITPGGVVSLFANVPGPVGLVFDDAGNLVVASCDANRLYRITPAGVVSTFATSALFNCANGLTRDEAGNFYVSNFNNGNVMKVTPSGSVSLLATVPGNNAVNVFHQAGSIYVTAREAHQIYRVSVTGTVELFAGVGVRGNVDGPALQAQFSFPNGITASPDGTKLYTNDVDPSSTFFHPSLLRVITLDSATPANSTTFGRVKALYR